ncbi:DUF4428 domain-containing protein [Secundilactobacillus collinoides]|uniref:DUF4428 domain-containing protein n=2 Tax=Secundilactobacillus collinoides TaxID=33960 RepID=A0A0R2B689_SECCO|nr:DUF4428 domain-containing protein [Secundilactobacillus collinoides]KRM74570.1 hypothetical protein FC82_GL003229 [Secundilactobacillus collinoides DSM 20515 = JCM 1123]KZL41414.1 hypothetical protein TY91_06525 [Secundilactobacillus collinoides]
MAFCPIDRTRIGVLSFWKVKDGVICNTCGRKIGLIHGIDDAEEIARSYTVDELKELVSNHQQVSRKHAKVQYS